MSNIKNIYEMTIGIVSLLALTSIPSIKLADDYNILIKSSFIQDSL